MKNALTKLLAIMMVLMLVLGTAAGCGKKASTNDDDIVVEDSTASEEEATEEESVGDEDSEEATDEVTGEESATTEESSEEASTSEASSTTKTAPAKTTGGSRSAPAATKTSKPAPLGKVDLKGYTIKIAAFLNADPKQSTNVYYEKAVAREKEVKAKYNVKIKYISVPGQGLRDKFAASVLAGDPAGDIVRLRSGWVLPTFAGKSYVQPANKYFDVSDPLWNPVVTKESMFKGVPMGVNHEPIGSYSAMLYNKTMVQKLGLPDPQSLVASKQWTWAKFMEYVKACSKDTDGDGKYDIFGSSNPVLQAGLGSNGALLVQTVNGKDIPGITSPAGIEALKWMQSLKQTGMANLGVNEFKTGKVAFLWWQNWQKRHVEGMIDKFGLLPVPIGPKANDYKSWWDEVHLICIPTSSKYPKESAAIYTDLSRFYPGVKDRVQYERDVHENFFLTQKDVDIAMMLTTKFFLDKFFAYPKISNDVFGGDPNSFNNIVAGKGTKSVEQVAKEKQSQYQSWIDELWNELK